MTSEVETLKTNEFLRRRKLRLQQVREQSKEIAKKIRERAKDESLRHIVDLDAKKQKEYFDRQEKLVKRLEVLYARGLNNIGASHQSASELIQDDFIATDLSKVRGREAAAELRKKKQEKLDEQKKLIDRKVQARETANIKSREKTTAVLKKVTKPVLKVVEESSEKTAGVTEVVNICAPDDAEAVTKNDMATQWDTDTAPNEWQPAVPELDLPKDDEASVNHDEEVSKSDKSKRMDLFACSKEMPTDLCTQQVYVAERRDTVRPSLTLVSEYLQTRKLRLRETQPPIKNKKFDDIPSLKQTIRQTRTTVTEGRSHDFCHVLDKKVVPVPSWHAERTCECCSNQQMYPKSNEPPHAKQYNSLTPSQINTIFSAIRPVKQCGAGPRPVLRSSSPFRRNTLCQRIIPGKCAPCTEKLKGDSGSHKKSSVTIYNHYTRDSRDFPVSDEHIVVRDLEAEEDAYSQALKEVSLGHGKDKEQPKKVQDVRNRVAVTKQTVEKEYKDTINFLNTLPKEKGNKVNKIVYMDERRQQMHNENRQHKLQQEYRKIEKECRRHHSCTKKNHNKSRATTNPDLEDDFDIRDFQYSWMPVPEGDGNLAIHTIPNTVKEGKSSNTVKFSKVDSYHEYRSRHKHTPPTKDTTGHEHQHRKKKQQSIIIDKDDSQPSDTSSASDTSSVENLRLEKKERKSKKVSTVDPDTSEAERIIIYKILDTKSEKHSKKKTKLLSDIAKSLTSIEKLRKSVGVDRMEPVQRHNVEEKIVRDTENNAVSFEHVNEGIYKVAEGNKENINSMISHIDGPDAAIAEENECLCQKRSRDKRRGPIMEWESGHVPQQQRASTCDHCSTSCREKGSTSPSNDQKNVSTSNQPSSSSLSSFKTAKNVKSKSTSQNSYIKLLDEAGQETGKFFLSDTGLLKDNAYEVVIQLRKRDSSKGEEKLQESAAPEHKVNVTENKTCEKIDISQRNSSVTSESQSNLNRGETENVVESNISGKTSRKSSPRNEKSVQVHNKAPDKYRDQSINRDIEESRQKAAECKNNVCDKATTTNMENEQLTSIVEPPPRPATNTYTQTNSSLHRPVYIHMSSSTSTAYMSPPDKIWPNFIRRNSGLTDSDTNNLTNTDNIHNPLKSSRIMKRCRHDKKWVSKARTQPSECRKHKLHTTPPNSLKSSLSSAENLCCNNLKLDKGCECVFSTKDQRKQNTIKTKSATFDYYRSSRNFNILTGSKATGRHKHQPTGPSYTNKNKDASLNPRVKGYINKLLTLNREGLKALEVADQECSSVGTPGSSIINDPSNVDARKPSLENKISLQHLKKVFMRQIIHEHIHRDYKEPVVPPIDINGSKRCLQRKTRRMSVHKVKSLNISKHLLKKQKTEEPKRKNQVYISTTTDDCVKACAISDAGRSRPRSSPSSRQGQSARSLSTSSDPTKKIKLVDSHRKKALENEISPNFYKKYNVIKKNTAAESSPDTEFSKDSHDYYKTKPAIPTGMSTQTNQNIDFMQLAEDKLHNMEKIADLTEKCTKRLSSLAKVLEEVRKNKSLVYTQISNSDSVDSHSDHKSDKVAKSPVPSDLGDVPNPIDLKSSEPIAEKKDTPISDKETSPPPPFISFLQDIPKPESYGISEQNLGNPEHSNVPSLVCPTHTDSCVTESDLVVRYKQKPPPALSRIHLKHGHEDIVPHELSTVIEVDSPMSIKNKTHSSRRYDPNSTNKSSNEDKELAKNNKNCEYSLNSKETTANLDLLQTNLQRFKQTKLSTIESQNNSKFQMIDLKHFNEIMLEPFISINEYAKKYNVTAPDEMSNIEELQRHDVVNDEISSLHSDGSLPDVIAELLKRNIITEPFKYDSPSNVNSTTVSSESTLSMLALSNMRKAKKKNSVIFRNKENIGETSDTLSISSNPDLENAFKKLGMGWASSTLKKTKERLALSSSSNTSSSSSSQIKIKNLHEDKPAIVTDSVSSGLITKKDQEHQNAGNSSNDAKHHSSYPDPMSVNAFLASELANKITFTSNKSAINETAEEFVSLFETKMPEGLNRQTRENFDENSDSIQSGINRARTSTPVQIFKSMTYHSSSSSNISNGLFSNADELSSVKMTSNSIRNHSNSDKDELTIPNLSLKMKKGIDTSKSD